MIAADLVMVAADLKRGFGFASVGSAPTRTSASCFARPAGGWTSELRMEGHVSGGTGRMIKFVYFLADVQISPTHVAP